MDILVIDDDDFILELLVTIFKQTNHTIFTASDSLQALDILDRQQIDLIISDLMMPHIDGLQLVKMLRRDQRYKDVPLIIITGRGEPEYEHATLRSGASFFLNKPFDANQLLSMVRFLEK